MELWAAIIDVDVIYSVKKIGARVICSAKEMTEDTAPPTTGCVTSLPPKRVLSTTEVVTLTAADATFRVTENCMSPLTRARRCKD